MSVENGMVICLSEALDKHYASVDPTAWGFATLQVLGDVREFCENITFRDGLANEADRALRAEHRLAEADTATVLAALLLAAHRNDAADTLRAARLLVERYLKTQDRRIAEIAGSAV